MKVGDVFHIWKGGNWKRYKCYVLAVVDENYIVYKWYGKHKQWWHYECEDVFLFDMGLDSGRYIIAKSKQEAIAKGIK